MQTAGDHGRGGSHAFAADNDPRALVRCDLQVRFDCIALIFARHRPNLRGRIKRMANLERAHPIRECSHETVVDGRIVRMDGLPGWPADLRSYFAACHGSEWPALPAGPELDFDAVRLLPPIPNPGKIICVAANFHEPSRAGKPDPEYPLVFTRFAESLNGHGQDLLSPEVSAQFDFEGELAVVIGKHGHKIARDDAMDFVAGCSCFNDGSVRDWQKHSTQFTPGKNFLRSGSMTGSGCRVSAVLKPRGTARQAAFLSLQEHSNGCWNRRHHWASRHRRSWVRPPHQCLARSNRC